MYEITIYKKVPTFWRYRFISQNLIAYVNFPERNKNLPALYAIFYVSSVSFYSFFIISLTNYQF